MLASPRTLSRPPASLLNITRSLSSRFTHETPDKTKASFAAMSSSSSPTVGAKDPVFSVSAGSDAEATSRKARELTTRPHSAWAVCKDGKALERQFRFKTFKHTWDFMNDVAAECKKQRHHPEWTNVYNRTHIRWTTHDPEGLSSKDTYMAAFCDQLGEAFGEVTDQPIGDDGR